VSAAAVHNSVYPGTKKIVEMQSLFLLHYEVEERREGKKTGEEIIGKQGKMNGDGTQTLCEA